MIRTMMVLAAAAGLATVRADDRQPDNGPYSDAQFVTRAAACCQMGTQACELATTNAKTEAVKKLAQMMIDDHAKTKEKLEKATQKVGQTVPTKLPDDQQKCIAKLKGLTGEDFDKEFLAEVIKAHELAIRDFKQAKAETKEDTVKDFASSTLSILEKHLDVAKKIQANGK